MEELWESPKSVANMLLYSDKNDIKNYLANFFVNSLYDNISSLTHKDEQLIYIVSLLLKNEINSLKTENSTFLNETSNGIILKEFGKRKEVQFFAKKIFNPIFEKLENKYSAQNMLLEINEIDQAIQILNLAKNINKFNNQKECNNENINQNDDKENSTLFNDKYIYQPLNQEKLLEKLIIFKKEDMIDYIQKLIIDCAESPQKYLNEVFLENIVFSERSDKIMEYYKNSFFQVIDIIDTLFDNLLNNIDLCPYTIKCFCKIISILIKKKFPKIKKIQHNKFLIAFFFQNLLFPILENPLNSLLNEFLISDSTMKKLNIIKNILNKLLRGILYEQNSFTPFNWYIIEKMPIVFEFFDKICQVSLPSFIDKLVSDELPEDYEYDYFKENPKENILYRNICFNIDELYLLIKNAEKNKNFISVGKKLLSKFELNKGKLEKLKNTDIYKTLYSSNIEYNIIDKSKIEYYYLLTDLIKNKELDKILNINNYNKNHFSLKELKEIKTEEQKVENKIIKVKNLFYALLYNYKFLSKNEFKLENLADIINILKELKNYSNVNSTFFIDNSIPLEWYINSLLNYLPRLPSSYKENNYEKLLNELEYEIANSLKELDFEKLSSFIEYFKEEEKELIYNEKVKNILNDFDINIKVKEIINKKKIYLDLNINNKQTQFFKNIMKEYKEYSNLFQNKEGPKKLYNNINSFINQIPNLENNQLNIDFNIFDILEKKKIPSIIENYSILIKMNLEKNNFGNEANLIEIYNKIYDYIMEQLYNKLFPKQSLISDIKIFENSCRHIWVEFQNLIKENKNYIFDDYLPDTINYFKKFEKEKSPRKKLLYLNNIFKCICNLAELNEEKIEGTDDEMPLLYYSLINSKCKRIYSSCKYTELFLGDKETKIEGSQLTKIIAICEKIKNASYNDFYNLTESDYIYNCDLANKGLIY